MAPSGADGLTAVSAPSRREPAYASRHSILSGSHANVKPAAQKPGFSVNSTLTGKKSSACTNKSGTYTFSSAPFANVVIDSAMATIRNTIIRRFILSSSESSFNEKLLILLFDSLTCIWKCFPVVLNYRRETFPTHYGKAVTLWCQPLRISSLKGVPSAYPAAETL